MRKPFKETVLAVEKLFTDYIAQYKYTDKIAPVVKKELNLDPDYATNTWRMINRLKEHDLYDRFLKESWNQYITRYVVDVQIPAFEEESKIEYGIVKEMIEKSTKNEKLTDEDIDLRINEIMNKSTPALKKKYIDLSRIPPRPPTTRRDTVKKDQLDANEPNTAQKKPTGMRLGMNAKN